VLAGWNMWDVLRDKAQKSGKIILRVNVDETVEHVACVRYIHSVRYIRTYCFSQSTVVSHLVGIHV
jgi:hypothetical protein